MSEDREGGPRNPSRRKFIKGAVAVGGLIALKQTGLAGKIADSLLGNESGTAYQTFPLPEELKDGQELEKWYEKIRIQLMENSDPNVPKGIVSVVDFDINVNSGNPLRARFLPKISKDYDTTAIKFNEGAHYHVEGAIEIKGNSVDPNDEQNGDRWAMIPGGNFGKEGDLFISLSSQTHEKIKNVHRREPLTLVSMNAATGTYRVANPEDLTQTPVLLNRGVS